MGKHTSHFIYLILSIAIPHIKKDTIQVRLNLNKLRPLRYAICEKGYVLYNSRIKTEKRAISNEILKPFKH